MIGISLGPAGFQRGSFQQKFWWPVGSLGFFVPVWPLVPLVRQGASVRDGEVVGRLEKATQALGKCWQSVGRLT